MCLPDTRNPTPETYIDYQRACCPSEATFSMRHLGKDGSAMKLPILSLRNSFLFLLTVFLLNLPGAVMAGSAAQIASQVEIPSNAVLLHKSWES